MQPAQIVIESDNVILDNECEPRHTPLEYKTKSQILHPAYSSLNEDIVATVKTVAGNSLGRGNQKRCKENKEDMITFVCISA